MSSVYSGEVQQRAVSKASLDTRLDVNRRYQSVDFHAWLMKRLGVTQGEQILDVGCGTGAQALRFLADIGPQGSVSALDISAESIEALLAQAQGDPRLQAVVADMAELPTLIESTFRTQRYSLAQSTYSLYYSPSRHDVLRTMAAALVPHGRLAIFNPLSPHGLVDLAARFGPVPDAVYDSLQFGPTCLEPWFRELFWEVRVDVFQSVVRVTSIDDMRDFYRATTYYSADAEPDLLAAVSAEIDRAGSFTYEKNGYLIQGTGAR
jgi:ubiquinone/menaquinone biosynthesis C-methylase UbiE